MSKVSAEQATRQRKEILDMVEYWEEQAKKAVRQGHMDRADTFAGEAKDMKSRLRQHRQDYPEVKED